MVRSLVVALAVASGCVKLGGPQCADGPACATPRDAGPGDAAPLRDAGNAPTQVHPDAPGSGGDVQAPQDPPQDLADAQSTTDASTPSPDAGRDAATPRDTAMMIDTPPPDAPVYAASCAELFAKGQPSGAYDIDPDGPGGAPAFRAYCDMSAGGGWTLLLKTDGRTQNFTFDSPYWTSTDLLNAASVDMSAGDAKLAGFATLSFREVRVGLAPISTPTAIRWATITLTATSLRDLFGKSATPLSPGIGRDAWLALLPGSTLQPNCNLEGVNLQADHGRVRLGILGNNENDCMIPDSWVGIGAGKLLPACNQNGSTSSTGNAAECLDAGGVVDTAAFGFVLVR